MTQKGTDIKIGGRFWSTTVDGKIIDGSQIDGDIKFAGTSIQFAGQQTGDNNPKIAYDENLKGFKFVFPTT